MSMDDQICGICYDSIKQTPWFQPSTLISRCLHHQNQCPNFCCCESCSITYISTKVKDHAVGPAQLTCPGNCGEPLRPDDVRNILKFYSQYDILVEYEAVLTEYNKIQANKNRRLNRTLPTLVDMKSIISFQIWAVGRNVQRCNGCHVMIEKISGCNHMTCQHCRHEFYWCCGQTYSEKHSELLCAPLAVIKDSSKYWGPIFPIRALTKTVALGVGVGMLPIAAIAGVPFGLYKVTHEGYKRTGLQQWARRMAEEREKLERTSRLEMMVHSSNLDVTSRQQVMDINNAYNSQKISTQDSIPHANVSQLCRCETPCDTISDWCNHLVAEHPDVLMDTIIKPQACLVTIRPGYLCPCRACSDDEEHNPSSAFCRDCNHPRMLHSDCVRSNRSKTNHWRW